MNRDLIFVFGSNKDGHHAGGAAKYAYLNKGAAWGIGEGLHGVSYAVPTMGSFGDTFEAVQQFKDFARNHKGLSFQVTRLGCGIAGFKDSEIAPIFVDAPPNCLFDEEWREYLPTDKQFWGTF